MHNKLIIKIPSSTKQSCNKDSWGFFSFRISGKTETKAIFKNPPAENGKIHKEFASLASNASSHIAAHAPAIPVAAVTN